jgi:hypothetical protein
MKNKQKQKKFKPHFYFGSRIKKIASKINPRGENIETLNKLSKYEAELNFRLSEFETLFLKASPKLRTILTYNPHLQALLMGAKPGAWISFEEMFPGDIENWLYLLKIKNIFFEKSTKIIIDELVNLKPNLIKLRDDFVVDLSQVKNIISCNLDIFAEFRPTPYVVITTDEAIQMCKKITLHIEMGRLPIVRNMLGLILGYPRRQVLMHKIIDILDLQILIPHLNDFSRYGFFEQSFRKEKLPQNKAKLQEIFEPLEKWEKQMNETATSFEEQKGIHFLINTHLNEHKEFIRKTIFKHYFLKEISANATQTIDNYIQLSFPRLSFPRSVNFSDFGLYWVEYQPDRESEYLKARILLAVKKIQTWQKKMKMI